MVAYFRATQWQLHVLYVTIKFLLWNANSTSSFLNLAKLMAYLKECIKKLKIKIYPRIRLDAMFNFTEVHTPPNNNLLSSDGQIQIGIRFKSGLNHLSIYGRQFHLNWLIRNWLKFDLKFNTIPIPYEKVASRRSWNKLKAYGYACSIQNERNAVRKHDDPGFILKFELKYLRFAEWTFAIQSEIWLSDLNIFWDMICNLALRFACHCYTHKYVVGLRRTNVHL